MIEGRCHCDNVSLQIPAVTEFATTCTCSICSRYAVLWGYYLQNEVIVQARDGLDSYRHGDCLIEFHRCAVCGCVTHYTATEKSGSERLAVNFRMFDPDVIQDVTIRTFDGASTWQYLDGSGESVSGAVSIRSVRRYGWGEGSSGWHLLENDQLSVIEESVPSGDYEQRHYHRHAQQFFYVLQGRATLEVEGHVFDISAGEGVHVPARRAHQLINKGSAELRFLVISSPRSHGDRVLSHNIDKS